MAADAVRYAVAALCLVAGLSTTAFAADHVSQVAVPARSIYPGHVIAAGSLIDRPVTPQDGDLSQIHRSRDALAGKIARRTLIAGRPIPLDWVRDPYVVTQGQPTLIVIVEGDLQISAEGIALQSGAIGEVIALKSKDSGGIVKGIVSADGSVRVGGR